ARGALQYTSELEQSGLHGDLHSFPTRRSSDLLANNAIGKESDLDQEFMVGHGAIMKERLQHTETLPGTQFHTVSELENFLLLIRSEEHTSELQSRENLVCRLLLEKKKRCDSGR